MAVVGLTTRIDVADLLEKRVRSRCSQRQLLLPALTGADDCSRVLGAALSLPSLLTYSSAFAAKAKLAKEVKQFRAVVRRAKRSIC